MIFKIVKILDPGMLENERLVLEVKEVGDIGNYILLHAERKASNTVSPRVKDPLWFPDEMMNIGDRVVVYTKRGNNRNRENEDHSHSYFLYWGLNEPVWVGSETPVLMEIASWQLIHSQQ